MRASLRIPAAQSRQGTVPDVSKAGNLLVFAHAFPPENSVGAARPFRFAKYLGEHGYRVDVVAAECAIPSGMTEGLPGTSVSRVIPEGRVASWLQRLLPYNEELPWVPAALREGLTMHATGSYDAVLSTSPPNATHLAALRLKQKCSIKWVADLRDPVVGNAMRQRKFTGPYNIALERLIFSNADAVIAVTDVVADGWRRRYPQYSSKINVIWNGFDPEDGLVPAPLSDGGRQEIAHVGSIYGGRHPGLFLSSLERLIRRGSIDPQSVGITLVGDIDCEALRIHELPSSALLAHGCLNYENRIMPRSEAIEIIRSAHGLLLLDGNSLNTGYTVPAKLFEYIRVGRPILAITARSSPVDRILSGSGLRYTCLYPESSAEEVDNRVLEFLACPKEARTPSPWFKERFDGRRQAATLASLLDGLLDVRCTTTLAKGR